MNETGEHHAMCNKSDSDSQGLNMQNLEKNKVF